MLNNSYDYLYRFIDLFYSYEIFKENINEYMFKQQIDDSNTELMQNLYMKLFNRYKGNFFRWSEIASIYNEVASRIEILIAENNLLDETISNIETVLNDTALSEDFDRENKVDDTLTTDNNYKTFQNKNTSQIGRDKLTLKENIVAQQNLFNNFIRNFHTLFRLHRDESVISNVYNKGGA